VTCVFELAAVDALGRYRRLLARSELARAAAMRAELADERAVRDDPVTLCVPESRKALRIFIEHGQRTLDLVEPEREIGELPDELMRERRREFVELLGDGNCAFGRVSHVITSRSRKV